MNPWTNFLQPKLLGIWVVALVFTSQISRAEEQVETLVTFVGSNGSYPGSVIEGPGGNFFGTTFSGGKYGQECSAP